MTGETADGKRVLGELETTTTFQQTGSKKRKYYIQKDIVQVEKSTKRVKLSDPPIQAIDAATTLHSISSASKGPPDAGKK